MQLPIYRATITTGKSKVIGLVNGIDTDNDLCSIRESDSNYVSGDICLLSTLEISFDGGKYWYDNFSLIDRILKSYQLDSI